MRAHVGTSGFSYPGWKGIFYPRATKPAEMLPYYSARLATVELNNSFYRLPTKEAFQGWAEQTPSHFTFAVKAPQRITHSKRLLDAGEAVQEFWARASVLEARLAPLLFQMPPNFRADHSRLEKFLQVLPETRVAMEFRHPSWFVEPTYELLRKHDVALVGGDLDDEQAGKDPPLVPTASFLYLRLRRPAYTDSTIRAWAAQLRPLPTSDAFIYFKHEAEGPGYAAQLQKLLG